MAIKYLIQYKDTINIDHKVELYDDSYSGSVIDIKGSATLTYSDTDNPLEVIRGAGLRIELEADPTLDFRDLSTEEQKTINVKYYRNSVLKFNGWINPEGWFEDYVKDHWVVSFDCIDGLGYLKDLAFVDDNGFPINEMMSQMKVLATALLRTGLQQNILYNIPIFYLGISENSSILDEVYINTDRYIKDDGLTYADCDTVIRSVLKIYGACITSLDGYWYVYKPNVFVDNHNIDFIQRYYFGGAGGLPHIVKDLGKIIGSDINNIPVPFINVNQSISIQNSIGAYRIYYKYRIGGSLIENNTFCTDDGATIDGWTIHKAGVITFPDYVSGKLCGKMRLIGHANDLEIDLLSSNVGITFKKDDQVVFSLSGFHKGYSLYIDSLDDTFKFRVILTTATNTYWLDKNNEWDSTMNASSYSVFKLKAKTSGDYMFEVVTPRVPDDGDIHVMIFEPNIRNAPYHGGYFDVKKSALSLSIEGREQGEFHDFQRLTKPSARVDTVKEVISGDNDGASYAGTLYENWLNVQNIPTTDWKRKGITEAKPILQIMGEEMMRMNPTPSRVFSGDIFGYIDYLSVISIDGLQGKWMIIGYSYDTLRNITSLKLREIFNAELPDLDYEFTLDYGNVVKPTIVG